MADRGPDWYLKASNDLIGKRDTEEARAVLEEARSALRSGEFPAVVIASLKAKGARSNAPVVVGRALELEMPGILRAAGEDLSAGRTETPAMNRARAVASGLLHENPSGDDFATKLKAAGAPDALVAHLANDPALRRSARNTAWVYFGGGALATAGALWFLTTTPPGNLPYGSGILVAVAVLLLWRGVKGLNRA